MAAFFSSRITIGLSATQLVEPEDFDRDVSLITGFTGSTSYRIGFSSTEAASGAAVIGPLFRFTLPADESVWVYYPGGASIDVFVTNRSVL